MNKIGVLTSGGDAPGMNAAIRAIVRSGISYGLEVYGISNGFSGLVNDEIMPLSRGDVSDIIIRGGTILGSARLPEFKELRTRELAVENLRKYGIEALVIIGGDGSYRGANALTEMGINCIGLPGTIDNDIAMTDYTIGFDTALQTIIENVDKLRDTSSSHHRCSVVEVMGNRCGDLALFSGLTCGAEIIITPETGFMEEDVIERLQYIEKAKKKRHAIIVISEKITDVEMLAVKISKNTGFSGRSTVLGHIQRGGSPSGMDRLLATEMGDFAVGLLMQGRGGECVGIQENKIYAMKIEEALRYSRVSRKAMFELHERLV